MADRFVSAGTAEEPPERDEEWLAAQRELDEQAAARKKREAASTAGPGLQEGGKTLYEVLQANKASKQEAFEESAKLKHQFRSLDDDEIDFLDSVMDSTRKKEDEVKRTTAEQLEVFRRQREEAEKVEEATETNEDSQLWKAAPKKRKRQEKAALKSVKLRRKSSTAENEEKPSTSNDSKLSVSETSKNSEKPANASSGGIPRPTSPIVSTKAPSPLAAPTSARPAATLGLDSYSSEED